MATATSGENRREISLGNLQSRSASARLRYSENAAAQRFVPDARLDLALCRRPSRRRAFPRRPTPLPANADLARGRARKVAERLASRADRLVALVSDAFASRGSPYATLLRHAGLEPAGVAEMAAREGVDGTLARLLRAGVYLTVDELKGRRSDGARIPRLRIRPRRHRQPALRRSRPRRDQRQPGAELAGADRSRLDRRPRRQHAARACCSR